jgi:hypothetical protein
LAIGTAVAGSSATYELSGGELQTNSITAGASGAKSLVLSGGTLRPYNDKLTIGATVPITVTGTGTTLSGDDGSGTGRGLYINAVMTGDGDLTIEGSTSVRILNDNPDFIGPVLVTDLGSLVGHGSIGGALDVYGSLSVGSPGKGTFAVGSLTFQDGAYLAMNFDPLDNTPGGTVNDLLVINGDLTTFAGSTIDVNVPLTGGALMATEGTWTMATYSGSLLGTGLPTFDISGIDPGYVGSISVGGGVVSLTVAAVPEPSAWLLICGMALAAIARRRAV